jgi:uncharacterized protein YukE
MPSPRVDAIASHIEAAKRILAELEEHADTAMRALERDGGAEFFAAVDERSRVLRELDAVVEALAHERSAMSDPSSDLETGALFADMARAAAAALESHEQLLAQTQRERDRLAAAVQRSNRPDSVALQYATAVARPAGLRTFSVTG